MMNKFLIWLYEVFESIGRARAAAELARQGKTKEANRLING